MTLARNLYVPTSIGQMHARVEGEGPLVVCLHWSPWSWLQYRHVLPLIAKAGYAGMAVDMSGLGQSAFAPMDMAGHAGILAEMIDAMKAPLAGIIGGHVGSGIALEYAIAHPGGYPKLILDGPATLSGEDTAKLFATIQATGPSYPLAGNERTYYFDQAWAIARVWDSGFEITDETRPLFADILACFVTQPAEVRAAYPLNTYRMRDRMALATQPVLALTAETDVLFPAAQWVAETVPGARFHAYPGGHPLLRPSRAAEYLEPILAFLSEQ
jgi:pimeloyl-ACP methyl ester carboxylesterase